MFDCGRKKIPALFLTIFEGLPPSPSPNDFLALEKTFCFFLGVKLPRTALKTLTLKSDDLDNADLAFLMDLPPTCFDKVLRDFKASHCST